MFNKQQSDNKKQWYLLILATAWLFIGLALTASIFYITKDMRSFGIAVLTAPPIAMLRHLYYYHFPFKSGRIRTKRQR